VGTGSYPQPWQHLQDRSPRLEWENFAQGWSIAWSGKRGMALELRARLYAPMLCRSLRRAALYFGLRSQHFSNGGFNGKNRNNTPEGLVVDASWFCG
jgi:hypothetical protein